MNATDAEQSMISRSYQQTPSLTRSGAGSEVRLGRKDKVGAIWSFRIPIPCWQDELARHVCKNGKYVASFIEGWQKCEGNRKDGNWRSAIHKDGK